MAVELIQKQPAALQLRYLQTLVEIGSEKNTTLVFSPPIDMFANVGRGLEHFAQATTRADAAETRQKWCGRKSSAGTAPPQPCGTAEFPGP
jgi:hypothetical protein